MKIEKNFIRFAFIYVFYIAWVTFFTSGEKTYMIWNIFLAFIPYIISICILNIYNNIDYGNKKVFLCLIGGALWLLFYPNAPYMITDLMHLSGERFYIYTNNGQNIAFSTEINMWNNFFTLVYGTLLGLFLGFASLNKIHSVLVNAMGKYKAVIIIIFINYLSGFAIFLGRFSRYNSWDLIIHPYKILKIFKEELNRNTIFFTFMFGTLSIVMYYLYSISKKEEKL